VFFVSDDDRYTLQDFMEICVSIAPGRYAEAFELLRANLNNLRPDFSTQPAVDRLLQELQVVILLLENSLNIPYDKGSADQPKPEPERCSFCGKSRDEVTYLVAGPNVYICDACIQISYQQYIEHDAEDRSSGPAS
jgi:hypothetical protein